MMTLFYSCDFRGHTFIYLYGFASLPVCVCVCVCGAGIAWYSVGSDKFHSSQTTIEHNKMKVQVLPALSDNYMYLVSVI